MMKTRVQMGEGERYLTFWCPGCHDAHTCRVRSEGGTRPSWDWDGNRDWPTLAPSVLCRTNNPDHPGYQADQGSSTCHLFLKAGQLQFLTDCTHQLAGQTVPLPDLPAWLQD